MENLRKAVGISNNEQSNKESRLYSACCLFENVFRWLDISHTYLNKTGFARCCFLTWTIISLFISHGFLLSIIVENIMKFGILSVVKQQPFCFYAGKLETKWVFISSVPYFFSIGKQVGQGKLCLVAFLTSRSSMCLTIKKVPSASLDRLIDLHV